MQMYRLVTGFLLSAFAIGGTAMGAAPSAARQAFLERQAKLQMLDGPSATAKTALMGGIFSGDFEGEGSNGSCDLDSDGDALPDCAETNTGAFVDLADTGTDPQQADTDHDGLQDGEELLGAVNGLDLPALGVNPLRRDLLVEYDWFDDSDECSAHSHRPTNVVLERVSAMYAAAPVQNPDGSTGIHIVQDAGQGGALGGGNPVAGHDAVLPGAFDAAYHEIRDANFDSRRLGYFHYVLLAHRYNGGSNSSGYGEIVGDDAIVTLNCAINDDYVARTVLHELGHNLGLDHGGFEPCNGKPNYNSLMNYRYQFNGLDAACNASGDGHTDGYSQGNRLAIDEASIDELQGVCGQPAIDWNANGNVETGIAFDINPGYAASCGGSALSLVEDFDDWGNVTLLGTRDASGKLKGIKHETGCAGAPAPRR
jgi:hypothetical protein